MENHTSTLISDVQKSHKHYMEHLEKKLKEQQYRQQQTIANDTQAKPDEPLRQKELKSAQSILDEESLRLADAIKERSFEKTETAQLLIDGRKRKLSDIHLEIIKNDDEINRLRKNKNSVHKLPVEQYYFK
ncbi:unnamed protein product [Didymodactylos carnosus]|uniref:Uncharacterized protein n=1 Tax=Didymodactylos carnosus TaxID=1234261 RepID=A0A8S2J0S4_9BILA|nr:unnamed protein product [Didymodactylos carnosus]CAF3776824.1 unnamed protein product [Didymodactylos carnosus]